MNQKNCGTISEQNSRYHKTEKVSTHILFYLFRLFLYKANQIMMHALQYNLMGKRQKCQGLEAVPHFHYGADGKAALYEILKIKNKYCHFLYFR